MLASTAWKQFEVKTYACLSGEAYVIVMLEKSLFKQ